MGFPDNRIRQDEYAKNKPLTNKTYCASCKKVTRGLMFTNANQQRVCPACAGASARGLTSASDRETD